MQLYNIIDWCHQWWWFGNWGHHRVGHDHLHNAVKHWEHSVHNCSLLIPLHFLMWHLKIDISDANYYYFLGGISHQIVAHRLAGEWWEARTLILPQYRALPHCVKVLPPSRYSFTQCYRNIADVEYLGISSRLPGRQEKHITKITLQPNTWGLGLTQPRPHLSTADRINSAPLIYPTLPVGQKKS